MAEVLSELAIFADERTQEGAAAQAAAEEGEARADRAAQPMGEAEALAREVGALVDRKDAAYGQSFDRSVDYLRLLWPGDIPADRVELVPFFVALFNKCGRLATAPDAFGEDALADLLGYVILFVRRQRRAARARQAAADAARAREGTFVQVLMGPEGPRGAPVKGSGQALVGTVISGDSQPWAGPGPRDARERADAHAAEVGATGHTRL